MATCGKNETRCLKLKNIPKDCSYDSLCFFLENKKRGGPIGDLDYTQGSELALVHFKECEDANKFLNGGPHKITGCPITVTEVHDIPQFESENDYASIVSSDSMYETPLEIDRLKLLVTNIGAKTSEDTLINFFESVSEADVSHIEWGQGRNMAVLSFKDEPDLDGVKSRCSKRKVDGQMLSVSIVNRSKCVKISNLPPGISEDTVRYHFENKKRGGPVEDVQICLETRSAWVRFKDYGNAENVCSMAHTLRETEIGVSMCTDAPGFAVLGTPGDTPEAGIKSEEIDPCRFLIENISLEASEDTLRNLLELKTDVDVVDVQYGRHRTSAVVTFINDVDLVDVKKCESKTLEGQHVRVSSVMKSRCVRVSGLPDEASSDAVLFFFENKKRGGPVDDVQFIRRENAALVWFENVKDAKKICNQPFQFEGRDVKVTSHIEILDSDSSSRTPGGDLSACAKAEPNPNQLLLRNMNPKTSEDTLQNFLEAKADADVVKFIWGNGKTSALVTFDCEIDYEKLKAACTNKQIDGCYLSVEQVKKGRSVKVTGMSEGTSEDTVRYYFENKKSEGGDIEDVKLIPGRNSAIVQFQEAGVAERVCSRKHTLSGSDVTVVLHNAIPGFSAAEGDDNEAKSSNVCNDIKGHWSHFVRVVPESILRFINKSDESKSSLKEDLQRVDAVFKLILQPKGVLLVVSKLGKLGTSSNQAAWTKQVASIVKACIVRMELEVREVTLPEMNPADLQEQLDKAERMNLRVYQITDKLNVVGRKTQVEEFVAELEALIAPKEQASYNIKPYEFSYLKRADFQSECRQKCPHVQIEMKSDKGIVTLKGPIQEVQSARLLMLQMTSFPCKSDYIFKTVEGLSIFYASSCEDIIQHEKMLCVCEKISSKSIRLYGHEDNVLSKAKDIIKKTITEEKIQLDRAAAASLKSADWRETRRSLMDDYDGQVKISEDTDVVILAAMSDVFQDVITKIDKYFHINTVRHVLLPADAAQVKFLKDHAETKIRRLQTKYSDEKVLIDFEEGSYSTGVKISGLNEGLTKVKAEVQHLLNDIQTKDVKLELPGINNFFKKGKGRDMLTAIEQNCHSVIEAGDRRRNRKPVKLWTTSAGVLSVVKGDICQLRVDAIVVSTHKDLKLVGGLGKAAAEKGGTTIQEEADKICKDKGRPSEGQVICTGSGQLPCKHVLHAVLSKPKDIKPIKDLVSNILKTSERKHIRSLALPALGFGNGLSGKEVCSAIVGTLKEVWGESGRGLEEIVLCAIDQDTIKKFVDIGDQVFTGTRARRTVEVEDDSGSESDDDDEDEDADGSDSGIDEHDRATEGSEDDGLIQVVVGELSKQKVDGLVNPCGKELNMSIGAVSKSLLEGGGSEIQDELKVNYPDGIKVGQVAVTQAGSLKCQCILHSVLRPYNKGQESSDLVLKTMVFKCLKIAESKGLKSLAFPALGTGKLGFPADLSADLMFQAVSGYMRNRSDSIQSVLFVIHPKDTAVKTAFLKRSDSSKASASGSDKNESSRHRPRGHRGDNSSRTETNGGSDSYTRGGVSVSILKGDLTKEKTDCIVSCCDESFELRKGALSKAILAEAGSYLQDECSTKKEELSRSGLAVTKGYRLPCKKVIHLKVQKSARDWGSLFLNCLKKADSIGMASLSLPALGTGGLKIPPEKMASSLLYAVNKFADGNPKPNLTTIRVVIFQGPMISTYKSVFEGESPELSDQAQTLDKGKQHTKSSSRSHTKDGPRVKPGDQIILTIYSDSQHSINKTKERIQTLCADEFDQKFIGAGWSDRIKNLNSSELSHLFDLASKNRVVLTRVKGSELKLVGRVKDVSEVKDIIVTKFQENTMADHMKEEAKMVSKLVQWSYTVGDKTRHFTEGLNCRLEKAYNAKDKSLEIKDPKGRVYTVDLKKMEEYPKGGGPAIKIARFEKAIRAGLSKMVKGEKEALAGVKTVYFKLKAERNFKGDAEDLHFRTAESQFYRLLGSSSSQFAVTMVEYVVNPTLIKKFRAAQSALKSKRSSDEAEPVLAFHGTNEGNIQKICEGGFKKPGDSGFAMTTDAGYYGKGVYFSEFPNYAMDYIKGGQKLLLSQVIQGKVFKCGGLMNGAPLQPGYDSHTSPDSKELIIFDTACILPCYIVHYGASHGDFKYN